MKRGDVIVWPYFQFGREYASTKLFLIMGMGPNEELMAFKTTSQPASYRPESQGCHSEESVFRFKEPKYAGFDGPTWVQFDEPYLFSQREAENKGARVIFTMSEADFKSIVNCFKKSPDMCNWAYDICVM